MKKLNDTLTLITSTATALLLLAGCATTQSGMATESPQEQVQQEPEVETRTNTSPTKRDRQVPNSIEDEVPDSFYEAASNNTRTFSGKPGSDYWQQKARYEMQVELNPADTTVSGHSTITYYNNSPNVLNELFLELAQNAHAQGAPRLESAEITGGVNLQSVSYQGKPMEEIRRRGQSGYLVENTLMLVLPDQSIMPGDSVKLDIEWSFKVPQQGASGRMGYSKDNLFFIAYWYPQMRVYDDVIGWFTDPFVLNAEFYHGFADYDVEITAPEQWIVSSTGELMNARKVLIEPVYKRLNQAYNSDKPVRVVTEGDLGKATKAGQDGKVTWHYKAENIRDFAFSATRESVWDATRAPVGDLDGDGQTDYADINALYRTSAPLWKDAPEYSRHSLQFLSDYTGVNYPWPHMTTVEGGGIIGGGMEFPMMTIIGSYRGQPTESLYAVIAHEIAHMWVPMQASTNERRYSWIDEGTTTFNENQAKKAYFPDGPDYDLQEFGSYLRIAGSEYEGEIMRWSDYHYNSLAFGVASYSKPGSLLATLQTLLGEETFNRALQRFMKDWQYKHPYPWDFFNTFEDVSGRDLDWFWRSWYFETWTLDQSVADVSSDGENVRIVIQDLGQTPMPSYVEITFNDGTTMDKTIEVDTWLAGATSAILELDMSSSPVAGKEVTRVEIDPEFLFPDADRSNNVWEKP